MINYWNAKTKQQIFLTIINVFNFIVLIGAVILLASACISTKYPVKDIGKFYYGNEFKDFTIDWEIIICGVALINFLFWIIIWSTIFNDKKQEFRYHNYFLWTIFVIELLWSITPLTTLLVLKVNLKTTFEISIVSLTCFIDAIIVLGFNVYRQKYGIGTYKIKDILD